MRAWQARTKSRTESETTRRSNVLDMSRSDLAQRRPFWWRQLQEPGPHLPGASQVSDQTRPQLANLVGSDKKPDISRVGFAQERAHPVGLLFRICGGEVLLELADRGVRPPKEVGARALV